MVPLRCAAIVVDVVGSAVSGEPEQPAGRRKEDCVSMGEAAPAEATGQPPALSAATGCCGVEAVYEVPRHRKRYEIP